MAALELRGITKRYEGTTVLDDINLHVEHGKLVCLLGPSGCGKTTMLRLIAGFIRPDAGKIYVGSRCVSAPGRTLPPERRNMSMIFQSYALWPHMTVAENVAYGLKVRKFKPDVVAQRVRAMLAVTHLENLAQRYPAELSGGQQQRAALARALAVEPETLLLDEPLSNLDTNLREEMRFEIRQLHERYKYTTVYVTHDQAEAMTTADVIVVMNQGRIEQIGTPEQIYQQPLSEFVARFIGGTNILNGRNLGDNTVACNGFSLRCAQGELAPDGETRVSIRQHHVRMLTLPPTGMAKNTAAGTVVRQSYLGTTRDYAVLLAGGEQVRVTAPMDVNVPVGSAVWLEFPPEHCRALTH